MTIYRNLSFETGFLEVGVDDSDTGELILGGKGMNGTLTIDGAHSLAYYPTEINSIVTVNAGSALEMHNGVTLTKNNTISLKAGAVHIAGGNFTMYGGEISHNIASAGGGVYMENGETAQGTPINGMFTMYEGAVISDNETTTGSGGGVYVYAGTFNMKGGTIKGNSTYRFGGGVFVYTRGGGIFTKTGGIICGDNAEVSERNIANPDAQALELDNGKESLPGHAVCVESSYYPQGISTAYAEYWNRNSTADRSYDLDSTKTGAAGGWTD